MARNVWHETAVKLGVIDAHDTAQLHRHVVAGLPWRSFADLQKALHLSKSAFAELLGISESTLLRMQRRAPEDKSAPFFPLDVSDQLLRLAHVLARAEAVFGDVDMARTWLQEPQVVLGTVAPLSMLSTEAGTSEVLNVLGRFEEGVFS